MKEAAVSQPEDALFLGERTAGDFAPECLLEFDLREVRHIDIVRRRGLIICKTEPIFCGLRLWFGANTRSSHQTAMNRAQT
jgi:hypothetical protein